MIMMFGAFLLHWNDRYSFSNGEVYVVFSCGPKQVMEGGKDNDTPTVPELVIGIC
jgi:hypothetical protein